MTGDYTTGADQRAVFNRDARQDDRPAPTKRAGRPNSRPEARPAASWGWSTVRICTRPDLRAVADPDLHDIVDHAFRNTPGLRLMLQP
jgi:hypothetical protein